MMRTGQSYSSGEWLVREGSEDDFIERWNAFIEWSLNNASGVIRWCWFGVPKNLGSSSLWERGRAKMRRSAGEGCLGCRSCSVNVGSYAKSLKPTKIRWRPFLGDNC